MKVILKQEVDNVGLAGDVVDVADGYGRNFLIPRGLAIRATRGALKEAETLTRARKAVEAKTLGTAEQYKEALEGRTLKVPARVDERGHLYGSVSAVDVQRVLKDRGHEIERRRIDVGRAIKQIGSYTAIVRLHPQVAAEVPIEVVDVEGVVTPESLEAARAAAKPKESLEERALAAADDLEGEPAEGAEGEAAQDRAAAEGEATADTASSEEPVAATAAPAEAAPEEA